jgi:hypothetical protein
MIKIIILFLFTLVNSNEDFKQRIQKRENIISNCEFESLQLGSKISDIFNNPIGNEDWNIRIHQDYIAENLGFAPWMSNGVHNTGLTTSGKNAKELQEKGGFSGKNIEDSPYSILNHKWLYMFGDSTLRQVWASLAAPFQGNHFERNSKEYVRQYCNKQGNRILHPKGSFFPEEGWGGPCGLNEVTCHVSGYGEKGLLTLDWKHFPYEDYDNWIWGEKGPWVAGAVGEDRVPDILTVQFGLHSCWHSHPEGLYSMELNGVINQTMINAHIADIPKLMKAIRLATSRIQKPGSQGNQTDPTLVVIITSGSTGSDNGAKMDDCILQINRATAIAAHAYGFPVLERGEIERRLMYKSIKSNDPYLPVEMHLTQPAQNIIATTLLKMLTCLDEDKDIIFDKDLIQNHYTDVIIPTKEDSAHRHKTQLLRPVHVPPP